MVVQAAPAAPPATSVPTARATGAFRRRGTGLAWGAGLLAVLAAALALFAVWLDPRYDYLVDDGLHHAIRAGMFDAVWRRGGVLLYPRWWPELTMGYGYPLLNFYSPGTYYLAEAFQLLGASSYRSLQLVALATVLFGAAGAYVLGAVGFRHPVAAVVLALVYVGSPYPFITNLYNRAAFPEALGLALLPWLLAAATLAVRRRGRLAPLGLGLAHSAPTNAVRVWTRINAARARPRPSGARRPRRRTARVAAARSQGRTASPRASGKAARLYRLVTNGYGEPT